MGKKGKAAPQCAQLSRRSRVKGDCRKSVLSQKRIVWQRLRLRVDYLERIA